MRRAHIMYILVSLVVFNIQSMERIHALSGNTTNSHRIIARAGAASAILGIMLFSVIIYKMYTTAQMRKAHAHQQHVIGEFTKLQNTTARLHLYMVAIIEYLRAQRDNQLMTLPDIDHSFLHSIIDSPNRYGAHNALHCQGIVAYARMIRDLACNHEVIMDRLRAEFTSGVSTNLLHDILTTLELALRDCLHIPHEHASLKSLLEPCRQVTYSLSTAGGEGREYASSMSALALCTRERFDRLIAYIRNTQ